MHNEEFRNLYSLASITDIELGGPDGQKRRFFMKVAEPEPWSGDKRRARRPKHILNMCIANSTIN